MIRKRRNQKEIPTPKTEAGKTKLTIRYTYLRTYRKPSGQLFSNRRSLSYPNLTKSMKTYIRFNQHKKSTTKHKTNRTITAVSHWNVFNSIQLIKLAREKVYHTYFQVYFTDNPFYSFKYFDHLLCP